MLLQPCECDIRFTSTEPEGWVLLNLILHELGCNNEFISHLMLYMVYTLRMLRSNVTTKMEESNHVSEDPCNQPLKKEDYP